MDADAEVKPNAVYILAAPLIFIILGVTQGRRPMELVRGMVPFFGEFEARAMSRHSVSQSRALQTSIKGAV